MPVKGIPSTEQITDEELIAIINDSISKGITMKSKIAQNCNMTLSQLTYRLNRLDVKFPELEYERIQKAFKKLKEKFRIIKGLLEYGFTENEVCQMIGGCSITDLRRVIAEENAGMEIKPDPSKENDRLIMPNHQLIKEIFLIATKGEITVDEITKELENIKTKSRYIAINKDAVENTITWLKKRHMWFSSTQLEEFKIKTQRREKVKLAEMNSYKRAAKDEEEKELELLIGVLDDSEVKAQKKSTKSVSTKKREAYMDYICANKYLIASVLKESKREDKEEFLDDLKFMMELNGTLVTPERMKGFIEIASRICGTKYALDFLRYVNSNLIEQGRTDQSADLEVIKKDFYRKIILIQGEELRKKGFSDEQIATFMRTNYHFRVSPNDVLFILSDEQGEVTNEQEKDRD